MSDLIWELSPALVLVALMVLGYFTTNRGLEKTWRPLANSLGLSLNREGFVSKPRLEGVYRGTQIRAYSDWDLWRHYAPRLRIEAQVVGRLPSGMRLRREREGIDRDVSTQDIRVGIPEIDHALEIQGDDRWEVGRLLRRPEMQEFVHAFFGRFPKAVIDEGWLKLSFPLDNLDERAFSRRLDEVLDFVHRLERILEAPALKALGAEAIVERRVEEAPMAQTRSFSDAPKPAEAAAPRAKSPSAAGALASAAPAFRRAFRPPNPAVMEAYSRQQRVRLAVGCSSVLWIPVLFYTVPRSGSEFGRIMLCANFALSFVFLFGPMAYHRCPACRSFIGGFFSNRLRLSRRVCPKCSEPLSQ